MTFISYRVNKNFVLLKNKSARTIVFVDAKFPNCQTLIQKVTPAARVIVIGSGDDGVKEISKVLRNSNCSKVHIFSSGTPGCIYLGNSELSLNTLITYSWDLESWFNNNSHKDFPRLWLYGSNVAAGDVGEEFMSKLTQITGAKIAASVGTKESSILSS